MFAIPPYILLIPYALILIVALFFGLVNIVHLFKYGARNGVGFLAAFAFICGTAIVLYLTWQRLPFVDWQEPMKIFATDPNLFR